MTDDMRSRLQASLGSAYTLERELGGGGMSRVFLAHDGQLDRQVVVKILMPALAEGISVERFTREIRLAASLQEPHIVPVLSAGLTAEGLPYYLMPFVQGRSLRERLDEGTVSVSEATAILRDTAMAVEYAHGQGVVHRDIKPENILLSGRTAVVTDFGIAKALSASKTAAPGGTLTQVGTSLGTPAYMSPEQAVGDTVDQRSDLYSWGVIAYELLAGAHPFPGKVSAQQFIAAHLSQQPLPIEQRRHDTPPLLAALVMRCLQKEPLNRPQTARELLESLERRDLLEGGVAPPRIGIIAKRKWFSSRYVALAVGLGAVAAIYFGGRVMRLRNTGTPSTSAQLRAQLSDPSDASIKTVAVLPFSNTSGNPQDDYFSEGMTDELAHALSRIPSLRTAARTSAYAFKGKTASIESIGKALNVGAVVEGTVRRSGDRLRVTADLTSTSDGLVLWSDTYESRTKDVFEVQDQFTIAIVKALIPALAGNAGSVASDSRGTSDREAYDLYLKGRYFWNKRTSVGLKRAARYFSDAVARDSNYALAYSGLADSYAVLAAFGFLEPRVAYSRAEPAALRALSLDSSLAEAHTSLGFIRLYYDLNPPAASAEFKKALALDPHYATAHLFNAWYLLVADGPDAAVREARVAEKLEPLSLIIKVRVASMLRYAHRYKEATRQLTQALDIDSTFAVAYDDKALVLASEGKFKESILSSRRALNLGYTRGSGILGYALARNGDKSEAQKVLADLLAKSKTEYVGPFDVGLVYTGLGDKEHAIDWFSKAFELRDHEALHMRIDPLLSSLSSEPRFTKLVARSQ